MINPYTGQDDGFAQAPSFDGGGGAPQIPELAQAKQTLAQLDQMGVPSAAPPAPAPQMPATPAPTAAGQASQIRQQQFGNIATGQQLDQRQTGIDQQAGQLHQQQAGTQAAFDAEHAAQFQLQQEEARKTAAVYEKKQLEAKAASDQATQAWVNAKPTKWFESQSTGTQLTTILSMALAHAFDAYQGARGQSSNLGQQATAALNQLIDTHRADEIGRIEKLKQGAARAAAQAEEVTHQKALALAHIEQKYAGIEKALELQARAQRSAMGMDQARIDSDQVVIDRSKRALEAEQRRLDAVNGYVDREMQMEMTRARRAGAGKAKGAPTDPNDPYAGMNANQRDIAMRKDMALEIPNLDGSLAGKARTPAEGKKLRDAQEATNSFVDNLQRLKEFIGREGTFQAPLFNEGARDEKKGLVTALAGAMTVKNHTGVLSAGEYQRYRDVVSSGITTSNARAAENIDKLIAEAQESYARAVRAQVGGKSAPGSDPGQAAPTTPSQLPPTRAAGQGAAQGPPAGIPPGSQRGNYQGRPGWRSPDGKRFYPD